MAASILVVRCGVAHAGTDPDLDCGAEKSWHGIPQLIGSSLDGGVRKMIFQANNEPTDICSAQHAKPQFQALSRNPLTSFPSDMKVTASVQIPFVRASTATMVNNGEGVYKATVDVGLTQSFSGVPASIGMQIIYEFPQKGGYSVDSMYVYDHLLLNDIYLDYRVHIDGL